MSTTVALTDEQAAALAAVKEARESEPSRVRAEAAVTKRKVADALDAGVPVRDLMYALNVTKGRVYQMRDEARES